MRRDMDLIRKLLFHFEGRESSAMECDTRIEGYDDTTVRKHLLLLAQAGLIVFEAERSTSTPERMIRVYPFGLSWAGHDFLEAARNDTLWQRAKTKLGGTVGGIPFDVLKALLLHYARDTVGLGS